MLYLLSDLSSTFTPLNVFRYITFRTGGAMFTAGLFVFWFGPWIISLLSCLLSLLFYSPRNYYRI